MEQLEIDLNLAKIFVKVVEYKSFSEAARRLGMPKSTVSRAISQLEKDLGLPLIFRTTRQFSLTHQGEQFYQDAKKIVTEFEISVQQLIKSQKSTKGRIKLTAPHDLGVYVLNPLIIEYSRLNPEVVFDVQYSDEVINIMREGFDLALRISSPKDSQLKIKKVGVTAFQIVATPQFWQKNGFVTDPQSLAKLQYFHFGRLKQVKLSKVSSSMKDSFIIKNSPQITINHLESLKNMVIASQGFTLLPDFYVKKELESGELVQVLKNYTTEPVAISWVMPAHKESPLVVRTFRDYITPKIQQHLV